MDDKNYADASERALLRVPDREAEQYMTLQEAKVAWTRLPDDLKARATIEGAKRGRRRSCLHLRRDRALANSRHASGHAPASPSGQQRRIGPTCNGCAHPLNS